MRFAVLVALFAFTSLSAQQRSLTPKQWSEDIAYFARELPKRHANAFHRITRATFDSEIKRLQTDLPSLRDHEVPIRLLQITAQIGDGHTHVRLPANYRFLPIALNIFGDDLLVANVTEDTRELLGAKVIAIGTMPVATALERARSALSRDENQWFELANLPGLLSRPEILHALGISASPDNVEITVTTNDGERKHALTGVARAQLQFLTPTTKLPLSRQQPENPFWFAPITENSSGLYVAFRGYNDFGKNARALLAALDARRPAFLVIDIRQNGGGDFTKPREELIPGLKSRGYAGQRLFVITGRRTFSAAMVNAIDFRNTLNATLVGEPPGERPNSYQENDEMQLPHSKLVVSYSTKYYKFLDQEADAVMPQQMIAPSWKAFNEGRDEALDWILTQVQ